MRPLLIAGPGRSGTTWLAELVDALTPTRLIFEPFHPRKMKRMRDWSDLYLDPAQRNRVLEDCWRSLFAGKATGRWPHHLDQGHASPAYALVKTIWTLPSLSWLRTRFPEVPGVLIVRDPRPTIASRIRRRWSATGRFGRLWGQSGVRKRMPRSAVLAAVSMKGELDFHAAVWATETRLALDAVRESDMHVVRYESLVADGNAEMEAVAAAFGIPFRLLSDAELRRPSKLTEWRGHTNTQEQAAVAWKAEIAPQDVRRIESIVEAFGLAEYLSVPLGAAA